MSHRGRCRILTRALIGPSEVEFERAPLRPVLTLDAVFSIQCLVLFGHLSGHRKQPSFAAAWGELYHLANKELKIHLQVLPDIRTLIAQSSGRLPNIFVRTLGWSSVPSF